MSDRPPLPAQDIQPIPVGFADLLTNCQIVRSETPYVDPSQWFIAGGIDWVGLVAGKHLRLLLILPRKFPSDRCVFGAEDAPLSRFACLSLPGLNVPCLRRRERDPPYLFKVRDGSHLPMMSCLLPAHG
ncbi:MULTISPECIES: hypothetical protein [Sphingobium]|uniref:hypothetical protein n=1 Tax=Sphingobium TaxID=165695 RepID=UPI00159C400F|nr:hypothetical protein [Sphingobium sp. 15-1]